MARGKSTINAESNVRAIKITIGLNNKNRPAESAGILATITNEVHDALRRHFCAHEISVTGYQEPKIPVRLKVRKR